MSFAALAPSRSCASRNLRAPTLRVRTRERATDIGERGNCVDGYQLVPVNWGINTLTKRGFFELLRDVTGGA